MKPSPEAFEQWRASPVTEWLMDTFLKAEMERTKREYQERAWHGMGDVLAEYRERYETLEWVRSLNVEIIEETMEMQE